MASPALSFFESIAARIKEGVRPGQKVSPMAEFIGLHSLMSDARREDDFSWWAAVGSVFQRQDVFMPSGMIARVWASTSAPDLKGRQDLLFQSAELDSFDYVSNNICPSLRCAQLRFPAADDAPIASEHKLDTTLTALEQQISDCPNKFNQAAMARAYRGAFAAYNKLPRLQALVACRL